MRKDAVQQIRKSHREEAYDRLNDNLSNTDTRKDNAVYPVDAQDGSSNRSQYRVSSKNLSIFDTEFNFERVPEKTTGEKSTEKRIKEKDQSWKNVKGNTHSSTILDGFFDKIIK